MYWNSISECYLASQFFCIPSIAMAAREVFSIGYKNIMMGMLSDLSEGMRMCTSRLAQDTQRFISSWGKRTSFFTSFIRCCCKMTLFVFGFIRWNRAFSPSPSHPDMSEPGAVLDLKLVLPVPPAVFDWCRCRELWWSHTHTHTPNWGEIVISWSSEVWKAAVNKGVFRRCN